MSAAATAALVTACVLHLTEHRSGRLLASLPVPGMPAEAVIAFEHSVLGTTVRDRYRFGPQARLVEERFDGDGYGLPHAAGPGEQLLRDGTGWRLLTDRPVHPLVVRPLPATGMRLELGGRRHTLADWSDQAILITATGCMP